MMPTCSTHFGYRRWRRCLGGLVAALAWLAASGVCAGERPNPFDDDPFRSVPTPTLALPAVPVVPGLAVSSDYRAGGAPTREELQALSILLQREMAAGRGGEAPFLHARQLYQRLQDQGAGAGGLEPLPPVGGASSPGRFASAAPAPTPAAAPAPDPREAIRNGLRTRLSRPDAAERRMACRDLAFFEIFLGRADEALSAWETAGPESEQDLQYLLVRALLNLSLFRHEDGADDLETALSLLEAQRGFRVRCAGFVTESRGYRDFTPRPDRRFRAGEEYALYFELDRVEFHRDAGEYVIDMDVALTLLDADGKVMWRERGLGAYTQRYRAPVRDIHLLVQHRLPTELAAGGYELVIHARDRKTKRQSALSVPVEIVSGRKPSDNIAGSMTAARGPALPQTRSQSLFDQFPEMDELPSVAAPTPSKAASRDRGVPAARPTADRSRAGGMPADLFGILDDADRSDDEFLNDYAAMAPPTRASSPSAPVATMPPTAVRQPSSERDWEMAVAEMRLENREKRLQMIEEALRREERDLNARREDFERRRESEERTRQQRDRLQQQALRGYQLE